MTEDEVKEAYLSDLVRRIRISRWHTMRSVLNNDFAPAWLLISDEEFDEEEYW